MWHVADIFVEPVNRRVDAVQGPATEESSYRDSEVEQGLVIHNINLTTTNLSVPATPEAAQAILLWLVLAVG